MAISSLIVETSPEHVERVAGEVGAFDGVTIEATDQATGQIVVVLEADSIDASHKAASEFAAIKDVWNVNLIYVNVEDECERD